MASLGMLLTRQQPCVGRLSAFRLAFIQLLFHVGTWFAKGLCFARLVYVDVELH